MAWENSHLMFKSMSLITDEGVIDVEQLPNSNINSISFELASYAREILRDRIKITYNSDNSIEKEYLYKLYPRVNVEGDESNFNEFAQKIYNDWERENI